MLPNKLHIAAFAVLAGTTLLPPGLAVAAGPEQRYSDCLAAAEEDPAKAFEEATSWVLEGGGDPARHCAAIALIQLGQHAEAARRLEWLGRTIESEDQNMRAEAFAQAAQAWLLAGDLERAYAAQNTGLELSPDNLELLVDRGITLASAANYRTALDDFNQAHKIAPQRADILVYRASVHRYLNAMDAAMRDVQRAINLAPDLQEGFLERGILRRLMGDQAGARDDWMRVLILDGETPAAAKARVNLEMMDVNADTSGAAPAGSFKITPSVPDGKPEGAQPSHPASE